MQNGKIYAQANVIALIQYSLSLSLSLSCLKSNLIDTVYLLVKIRYDNHIQNACESKAKGFEPYICLLKLVMNFFFFLIRNIKISFDNIKY